jgi:HSP20 family protein
VSLPVRTEPNDTSGPAQPWGELARLSDQLNQLLEGWPGSGRYRWSDGFAPLADLEETDDAYLVEVELPGVKKHDVAVEISGRRVIVDGERKELERAGVLRRRTRAVGRFHHEVVLPGDVDAEAVSASLEEGVLTVRLPKPSGERPKRIEVR